MAGLAINRVTNANVYLNGASLLGRVEEIKLPDVEVTSEMHNALGLIGEISLPSGFKAMEGEIKWNSVYADVATQIGDPFAFYTLQVRSSVDQYGSAGRSAQIPLVTLLTVQFKNIPLGNFKPRNNAEFMTKFSATYVKQSLNGQDLFELDVLANILKVGGVDKLALFRANQGGQ